MKIVEHLTFRISLNFFLLEISSKWVVLCVKDFFREYLSQSLLNQTQFSPPIHTQSTSEYHLSFLQRENSNLLCFSYHYIRSTLERGKLSRKCLPRSSIYIYNDGAMSDESWQIKYSMVCVFNRPEYVCENLYD